MDEPIPLSLVQSGMDLTEPRPTPRGDAISWVQRWGRSVAIVQAPIGGGAARIISHGPDPAAGRGLGGGCYTWAGDDLVYVTVAGSVWHQPAGARIGREVTAAEGGARAPQVGRWNGAERFVVYVVDEAMVMRTSLDDGSTMRLDDGRHAFCFDPAVAPDGSTVSWTGWSPPHMPWDAAVRVDCRLADAALSEFGVVDAAVQQPRFAPDGTPVHVHDGSGWLNVYVDAEPVHAEAVEQAGPTWGMGNRSYDISPDGNLVAIARNQAGFGSIAVVDRRDATVTELGRGVHGHLSWLADGSGVVAVRSGARTPTEIVVYRIADAPTSAGSEIGSATRRSIAVGPNVNWDRDALVEPELVEAHSSVDGATLHARRYVAGDGRLLCWVHGGPTDQWQVDWRPRIEYWRSRGWDVLVVDPRGTTGHGRSYQQALHGRWGRLDVDDTADLIGHAHGAGWSSPERTVVIGGSSGGLTALGLLADHGELVAGAVTAYPVSDLRALTEATHRFEAHYTDTLVAPLDGSDASERAFADLSPITRAEQITSPLLLFHGTDDPVVPIEQSHALVERVRAGGGFVDFVVYEGEGHGFRDPDNVADEYRRTESFLARFG